RPLVRQRGRGRGMGAAVMSRRGWKIGPFVGAAALAGLAGPASAAPPVPGETGETRSLLRDVDMPQSFVAGEADAASVAVNPAAMGFLRGLSGVLAGNYTRAGAQRRGGGF